jgi:hypothetical protein
VRYGNRGAFRRIGPKRLPSTRDGLTRNQSDRGGDAQSITVALARRERMTITKAGELLVETASTRGLKRSTVMSYESEFVGSAV